MPSKKTKAPTKRKNTKQKTKKSKKKIYKKSLSKTKSSKIVQSQKTQLQKMKENQLTTLQLKDTFEKKPEKKDIEKLRKDLWANETASWVLAVLGLILVIFLTIYLVWSYISQKEANINKIYLDELKAQLGKADFSGSSVLSLPKIHDKKFYLAFFPKKAAFIHNDKIFISPEGSSPHLCICELKTKEADCSSCITLKQNASLDNSTSNWVISLSQTIKIEKTPRGYVFSRI